MSASGVTVRTRTYRFINHTYVPFNRLLADKLLKHLTKTKKEKSPYYELCVDELSRMHHDDLKRLVDVIMAEEYFEENLFDL
jgi:hypothetical protein